MLNKLPEKHYFFIIAIDKVDSAHCCLRIASKNILKVRLQRSFFLEGQRLMNNPGYVCRAAMSALGDYLVGGRQPI